MKKARPTTLCLLMLLLLGCGLRIDVYTPTPTPTPMPTPTPTPEPCDKEAYFTVGAVIVWRLRGDDAFFFESGMTITADGAPDAYHPSDDDKAQDYLANCGKPGNWWACVTDEDGELHIQGPDDPMPGYCVSTTALQDETKAETDPRRYVNASEIPAVVLPYNQLGEARLGDFAVAVNRRNERLSYAIFADLGPPRYLGEGSIALAEALGIPSSAKDGGTYGGVVYVIFPNSGNGKPRPVEEINSETAKLFEAWGGMKQLEACFSR